MPVLQYLELKRAWVADFLHVEDLHAKSRDGKEKKYDAQSVSFHWMDLVLFISVFKQSGYALRICKQRFWVLDETRWPDL